jgi:murein DD-endopeptidase MepM/ murein hydrolase activator NlpD
LASTSPDAPRRKWTIVIVPPQPSGRTHTLHVYGHHVRRALTVALVGFLAYTGWTMTEAMQVSTSSAQLAEVHQLALTLSDSLHVAQQRADSALELAEVTANVSRGLTLVARHSTTTPAAGAPHATLPVLGTISSRFSQSRLEPILNIFRPHEGVDIAAPLGTKIRAPADGRVTFAGHRIGYGLVVELAHGGGVSTLYAHCEELLVKVGDYVAAGAAIAKVGSTGLSTAPHVHFEVRVNGRHVDPLRYLLEPREPATALPASAPTPTYIASDHE